MQNFSGKRLTAWLLTIVMIVGILPVGTMAAGWADIMNGYSALDKLFGGSSSYALSTADEGSANQNTRAAGYPVVVIAGSDYQQSGTAPKTNVTNILNAIVKDYETVDGFMFGGDYSQTINNSSSTTSGINELKGVVQGVYGTALNEVYVQGNHDAAVSGLTATGAHDTDYYGVFSINEDDFPSGGSVSSTMLTNLQNYLNGKVNEGYKKPIFVVTHLPLHKTTRYDSNGTGASIFNVLNEAGGKGLNIIFLFGHNHSGGYDAYLGNASIYLPKGDKITVDGGSTETILNFTYANYGYVGYVSGSSCTHLTMTAFEIYEDEVIVKRYDSNGLHTCGTTANVLKAAGGGTVPSGATLNTTVYTSPQSITLTTPSGGSSGDDTGTDTPTTPDTPTGGSGNVYTLDTDGIDADEEYLIVSTGSDGTGSALTNSSGSSTGTDVTISGGQITLDNANAVWIFSDAESGNVQNGTSGYYIYPSTTSGEDPVIRDETCALTFSYEGEGEYVIKRTLNYGYTMTYYVDPDSGNWDQSSSETSVYLFKKSGTGTGGGTVTPSGGDWVTITEPDGGTMTYTYTQATSITANGKYVIVGYEDDVALINDNGSFGSVTDVVISGTTMTSTTELTEWTFSGSSQGSVSDGSDYLYSSGSYPYTFRIDSKTDTLYFTDNENNFAIKASKNSTGYAFYYNGSNWATSGSSSAQYVRLFQLTGSTPGDDATPGLYGKIDGELTYTVPYGATAADALAAVKAGIDILYHSGDASAAQTYPDDGEGMSWTLASNYDGSVPGEYAVTIKYDGKTLGTVKVIVPNVGVEAEDILYYIDETKTAPINATLVEGTTTGGSYTYEVVEGGDAIIESIASDGTITFTGTEGTAQVKITYTYTEDGTTATLEKVINVTAKDPYYTVELYDSNGLITAPIALKAVKTGDTYNLTAVVKEFNGKHPAGEELTDAELRWDVSDTSIATIDPATGVLTFTGTSFGTFQVNVYYLNTNGEPVCEDTVTFSVSESQYVVPGDGTNDFPEYPEQGAIRFDKTAVAQGNFSASGIAKVELSMTGVPYVKGSEIDVVLMLDRSRSMSASRINATVAAAEAFIKGIVINEDGSYNGNRIYLGYFMGSATYDITDAGNIGGTFATVDNDTEFDKLIQDLKDEYTAQMSDGGTDWQIGLERCENLLNAAKTDGIGDKRQQFCVFMSDGAPSDYRDLDNNSYDHTSAYGSSSDWVNDNSRNDSYKYELYSTRMKGTENITIYSVLLGEEATQPQFLMNDLSGPAGETTNDTGSAKSKLDKYYFNVPDANAAADMESVFNGIAISILQAATDVVVEDKIHENYTMNFSLPSGVTADEAGMDEFYIQVLGYELDEHNDRKANPTVLEKFLFNSDNTITHTIGITTCEDCAHVTMDGDKITGIYGTYFDYEVDANGDEFLTWTAEKLDRTELALEYFVYLDHSAGENPADQIGPGTYPTNEYATITYKNFNGKECQQSFPVPTMTWMGAKVTYTFYLVNSAGQPVNRAGKVIPFAEAFYVADPVTIDVTWNDLEGSENMLAENLLATAKVPDVYSLYDDEAYYEIRVYQTEDENKNYFIIEGADDVSNKETTKVFNTKAGTRFDEYGAYSATAGKYISHQSNTTYDANVTTDIDYANTTVAFAVVWKPELNPDTVVIDYGLDVVIDVTTNDALASGVTGVSNSAPVNVDINKGQYDNSINSESATIIKNGLIIGTAKVENLTSVRFSLNKVNGMQFSERIEFFYESKCNFYTYDTGTATLNTTYMYSSVTVIPATSIYYEESFLSFTNAKDENGNEMETNTDNMGIWITAGTEKNATQDQDRPGESQISVDIDADNVYGYDSAYDNYTTYSLGAAEKVTVDKTMNKPAFAPSVSFTFKGTGFDIVSLTDYDSGMIRVTAVGASGASEPKTEYVNNYYGYAYGNLYDSNGKPIFLMSDGTRTKQAYELSDNGDEELVLISSLTKDVLEANYTIGDDGTLNPNNGYPVLYGSNGEKLKLVKDFYVDKDSEDCIYQVPVIKMDLGVYDTYTVTIEVIYLLSQDMKKDESYSFWMDAVRIYDPANNGASDSVIKDAYIADNEYNPNYITIRDYILKGIMFTDENVPYLDVKGDGEYTEGEDTTLENGNSWNGVTFTNGLFIDGNDQTSVIYEYANPGPNNELYLAMNQSVSFKIVSDVEPASVQIGAKLAYSDSESGVPLMMKVGTGGTLTEFKTLATATDMYYELPIEFTRDNGKWVSPVLTFANTSIDSKVDVSSVISLTNIKVTQKIKTAAAVFDIEAFGLTTLSTEPALFYLNAAEETENTVELITDAETLAVVLAMIHPAAAFTPEKFDAAATRTLFGSYETLTVSTSADVEYITINGETMTKYSSRSGSRIWTYRVKTSQSPDEYEIIAYNAEDLASDPIYTAYNATGTGLGDIFQGIYNKIDSIFGISDVLKAETTEEWVSAMYSVMEKLADRVFKPEYFRMDYNRIASGEEQLVVSTSEDVEYIIADGEIIDNFITETIIDLSKDGEETVNRVWLVPDADENAEVAAYNAEGVASENAENN